MGKRIIFGGTTEGRLLAQREHDAGRNVLLPTAASISACESAGIPRSHIIAMQGRSARGSTTRCMRSCKLPSW